MVLGAAGSGAGGAGAAGGSAGGAGGGAGAAFFFGAAFFLGGAFFAAFLGAAFLGAAFLTAFFGAAFFGAAFFGAAFLAAFFTGLAAFFAGFFLVAILVYLEHSCAPLCGSSNISSLARGKLTILYQDRARMMTRSFARDDVDLTRSELHFWIPLPRSPKSPAAKLALENHCSLLSRPGVRRRRHPAGRRAALRRRRSRSCDRESWWSRSTKWEIAADGGFPEASQKLTHVPVPRRKHIYLRSEPKFAATNFGIVG